MVDYIFIRDRHRRPRVPSAAHKTVKIISDPSPLGQIPLGRADVWKDLARFYFFINNAVNFKGMPHREDRTGAHFRNWLDNDGEVSPKALADSLDRARPPYICIQEADAHKYLGELASSQLLVALWSLLELEEPCGPPTRGLTGLTKGVHILSVVYRYRKFLSRALNTGSTVRYAEIDTVTKFGNSKPPRLKPAPDSVGIEDIDADEWNEPIEDEEYEEGIPEDDEDDDDFL